MGANWALPRGARLALLAFGLALAASGALAQQPTAAQRSAVKSACRSDYITHCSSVPPGGKPALDCLKSNLASLSPACQTAVNAIGAPAAAAAPAAPAETAPADQAAPAQEAPAAAAPAAPAEEAPAALAPAPPMSLREEARILRRACGPDYRAFCAEVRPGGGRGIACLRAHAHDLSPRCKRMLAAGMAR